MKFRKTFNAQISPSFWILTCFLALVFLTGGSSRGDVQSLVLLRPAAAAMIGYGLWQIKIEQFRQFSALFSILIASTLLVSLHLIPMPPIIWGALPGRNIVTELDRLAGLGSLWRPLTLAPASTWNAIYSLLIPWAILLGATILPREDRFRLLPVFLCFGVMSGFWGFLQAIGSADGPLYLYRITNLMSSVGLFANRNHQALLLACMFPMLSVFACVGCRTVEQANIRRIVCASTGLVIVPLLLVTGSRAGLVLGIAGLASIPFLYQSPSFSVPPKRKHRKIHPAHIWGSVALVTIILSSIVFSRSEALDRIIAIDGKDLRFELWGHLTGRTIDYMPLGSGAGSFVEAFQISEPRDMLGYTYMNHAHNEWLEIPLTLGLPGIFLLLWGGILWILAARRAVAYNGDWTRDLAFSKLGVMVVGMIAIASSVDYPARVPSLTCLLMVAAIWMSSPHAPRSPKS